MLFRILGRSYTLSAILNFLKKIYININSHEADVSLLNCYKSFLYLQLMNVLEYSYISFSEVGPRLSLSLCISHTLDLRKFAYRSEVTPSESRSCVEQDLGGLFF